MSQLKKLLINTKFVLLIFISALSIQGAAGEVDPTFDASITKIPEGAVHEILVQPDGKILIGGNFRVVNDTARSGIARLNADGTLDTTFNPPDIYNSQGYGGTVFAIALQSDGKIVIGGDFLGLGDVSRKAIARLNPDGSLDNSFSFGPLLNASEYVVIYDIEVYPDDKVLIGGFFDHFLGISSAIRDIARLNADGTRDTTFSSPNPDRRILREMILLPNGKIIIAGGQYLRRINPDGTDDNSFMEPTLTSFSMGGVFTAALQSDGKILIGGDFDQVNGFTLRKLARFNPDGSVDTTFNTNNAGPNGSVQTISVLGSGKILIGGAFTQYNGTDRRKVALINANGTLDVALNYISGFNTVYNLAVQNDGKILVGGQAVLASPLNENINQNALERINTNGSIDSSFNVPIGNNGEGYEVLVQPDGKILVGGYFSHANGEMRKGITRFNQNGTLDTSFNETSLSRDDQVFAIELQADGKILIGGMFGSSNARRLNPDGSLDITFPSTPNTRDIKVLPNGKILIVGQALPKLFNPDGTLDTSFNVSVNNRIYRIVLQADGKIILVGDFTQVNGVNRGRIARINTDGSVDTTFNPPGGANNSVFDAVLQSDGKIIIGGSFTAVNFVANRQYLARLNSDGSLDTSFAPTLNAPVLGLKVQSNDKILVAGAMSVINNLSRNGFARLNRDGTVDLSFNIGRGANSTGWNFDLQPDGKILLVGQFFRVNGKSAIGIVRLLNDSNAARTVLFDFDGDGKADISVFRPSTNRWYEILSSNAQVFEETFGAIGDIVAPADFDGDGKTDLGIFRPSTGDWWYLSSLDGRQKSVNYGMNGDIPLPSDFDSDGKADFIVYRPSNNVWYRLGSSGQVSIVQFGAAGDKPLIGDFDGDGKSDLAVFRPSTGEWWYLSSANGNQIATRWGVSTDVPVPADYDGDGKTDLAVYRPSTGVWYILNSSDGSFTIVHFGLSEDKPVAADYDGDGRADIAVYRPSTGVWYLLRSTAGFAALNFGVSTDIPIPNAFIQP